LLEQNLLEQNLLEQNLLEQNLLGQSSSVQKRRRRRNLLDHFSARRLAGCAREHHPSVTHFFPLKHAPIRPIRSFNSDFVPGRPDEFVKKRQNVAQPTLGQNQYLYFTG
jgi:hypothetical protein